MPSIIGNIKIVSNGGEFINGDTIFVSPTSSSKSYSGSGGGLTGDFSMSNTVVSLSLINDPDVNDSNTNKVATGS